ncbi:ABC transporter permease [Actinobacillus pleuropneumoniae]|uniref:ABC transporter permease n=1 Tax=Actinobacillus pleuropneumoniae TaxID=715 RepID=UPI0001E49408|nr:ABC transporter permease [Actinobacillus pleuropneumoniae]EFM97366.1 ABC transporter: transmembrane protein [Actinobacillus pleuropneumoniae serovar 10 str. D13039]UKH15617.1 ABC transporter permease [Actinobacillus pleuropneumoniae]UKH23784.1 ABC transporter permease [Actinobacillus pleuropneumoniae]UKH31927.1 ABC transporter permease [Actinobacillus pleuropneumoniae serovar 10 str. D13039]
MLKIIFRRLLQIILVIWSVGTLTFILTRQLSGDMAYRIAASRYGYDQVDSAAADLVRTELGLDQPWWQSYGNWLLDLLQLNLGKSLVTGDSVWSEIAHQFGHTLSLALVALVMAIMIGPILGVLAARKENGFFDRFTLVFSTLFRSVPAFIIAIGLITLFSATLRWLPAGGYGKWQHFVLPAFTLALGLSAVSVRVTRAAMLQVKQSEYYQFARLKGLSKWQTFTRHGIRNIAIPVIAYHAVQLVYLIEGVVVVESLFAWPGSGHALVHAIIARDVPMIQGTSLVMGGLFVLLNMCADMLSAWIDPRIIHKRHGE